MVSTFGIPVIASPDNVRRVPYQGTSLDVYLTTEETGGRFFASRSTVRPEDAPPFHRHTREDEVWIVNRGRFRFWIGGESLADASVHEVGPRDIAHTFQVLDDEADVTIFWSPSESESYFLNVPASEGREDFDHPERLESIGVVVLDRAPMNGR